MHAELLFFMALLVVMGEHAALGVQLSSSRIMMFSMPVPSEPLPSTAVIAMQLC